jgi:hypothetical protein
MQQICLHMQDPREPHLMAMKRILRYLLGTPDFGLLLRRSSNSDLIVYKNVYFNIIYKKFYEICVKNTKT